MNKISIFLVALMAFVFTGCFDVIEEMYIDKDGSGQYMIVMDASGLMADGGLRSMMQSLGGEEAGADNPFSGEEAIEVDTLMLMSNAADSIKAKFKHPELLGKMSMHQQISEAKELMKTSFVFDFDNVGQINMFLEDMQNMSTGSDGLGALGMSGPSGMVGSPVDGKPLFTLGKKMLIRGKSANTDSEALDEQSMAMMKMMLADATFTTIYNFPGRVKKTTIPNAVANGKQLKVSYDILDVLEGKIDQSGTIKFAKK